LNEQQKAESFQKKEKREKDNSKVQQAEDESRLCSSAFPRSTWHGHYT
jgi:hypothetical protein